MKHLARISFLFLTISFTGAGFSQQRAQTGSVVVHISCADTGAPARYVSVTLTPVPSLEGTGSTPGKQTQSITDSDGDAAFNNVFSGMYFVDATLAGYIQPLHLISDEALQSKDSQTRNLVLNSVPHVTVESSTTARAVVAIERGAAVSGRVAYDDGAPIESIFVELLRAKDTGSDQKDSQPTIYKKELSFHVQTDDRGMYRIAGLSPGMYVASARISMNHLQMRITKNAAILTGTQPGDVNLTFYAPATTQRTKAQQIALAQGDERQGIDLVADLSRLHSIGGYVNRQGVMLPGANLELYDVDDPVNRHGTVTDETGYFRFDLLPQANYKLKVYTPRTNQIGEAAADEPKPAISMPVPVTNTDALDLNIDISRVKQ